MHTSAGRSVVVGLFESKAQASGAVNALQNVGLSDHQLGVVDPNYPRPNTSGLLPIATQAGDPGFFDALTNALASNGVPTGEARFYAEEALEGRTLLVADADGRADAIRELILEHGGYDVRSRGRDLARANDAGVPGGTGAMPPDLTRNWEDVRSRYQMLWQQHYGTTDAVWEQMEPVYRFGWRLANEPRYRGRPWSEVAASVRRDWEAASSAPALAWSEAEGPLHDVWEDVAEEAAFGAEGGADRRIARQGTDQAVAARDVESPRTGAA